MLTEIFRYLRNWFWDNEPVFDGEFIIQDGQLNISDRIEIGQYYRIFDSVLNDGVWFHDGKENLKDESFKGTVRLMAVPDEVTDIINDINVWMQKYGTTDSEAMSPYTNESFGGYSYSKGIGTSWSQVFGSRLKYWRKI